MIDQEPASIIRFILAAIPEAAPHYFDTPKDFAVPAVYFPAPTFTAGGDTFLTYAFDYTWNVEIFHKTTEDAIALARRAADAIMANRRLVPLVDEAGELTGKGLRLHDPKVGKSGMLVANLTLGWASRRPYHAEDTQKMMSYILNINDPEKRPPEAAQGQE